MALTKVIGDGLGAIPAISGASLTSLTSSQVDSGATTAKAWVNFNGTGTVAIGDSHNVSSITDVSTGFYKIIYANALGNANQSLSGMIGGASGIMDIQALSTTEPQIITRNLSGTVQDQSTVCVTVFGD